MALVALLLLGCTHAAAGKLFLESRSVQSEVGRSAAPRQVCADLVNRGTYFAVDVEVGTPPQKFSIVADTGSNTLIVPSCICQQAGYCDGRDRCFTGTNKSSTFTLLRQQGRPLSLVISFGSGQIQGVIAREEVSVGGLKAYMKKGVMLMTAKQLNFGGPFEGILGLGIPHNSTRRPQPEAAAGQRAAGAGAGATGAMDPRKIMDYLRKILGGQGGAPAGAGAPQSAVGLRVEDLLREAMSSGDAPAGADGAPSAAFNVVWEDGQPLPGAAHPPAPAMQPPSFLDQAGVSSFGICFNEGANGVLRLGMPPDDSVPRHTSVGVYHWGLGLDAISVTGGGGQAANLSICSKSDMQPGQDTACGAIVDSGTTMITGPSEGIAQLLDSVCERWPRCQRNHSALQRAAKAAEEAAKKEYGMSPWNIKVSPKFKVLQLLLKDCESWIGESSGLAELPPLLFHVAGANGTKQALELPPHAYVLERTESMVVRPPSSSASGGHTASAAAEAMKALLNATQDRRKVCEPAFSVMEYRTRKNGPVWILGTPLFYQFNVGYDLGTTPPSLTLRPTSQSPCGSCLVEFGSKVGLVGEGAARLRRGLRRGLPVEGAPRGPSFDAGLPL